MKNRCLERGKINGKTEKTTRVVFMPHFSRSSVFPSPGQEPLYPIHFCRNQHTFFLITFFLIKYYMKKILLISIFYVTSEAKIHYPNPYPYLFSSLGRYDGNSILYVRANRHAISWCSSRECATPGDVHQDRKKSKFLNDMEFGGIR